MAWDARVGFLSVVAHHGACNDQVFRWDFFMGFAGVFFVVKPLRRFGMCEAFVVLW